MGKHFRKLAGLCLFALLLGACGAEASNPSGTTDNPPVVNPPTVDPEQTYTITWKNYDGSVLEVDQNVKKNSVPTYDGNPPTRPGSAQFSYVFSGWSPMVVAATADATYTAQFTSSTNGYTVTWKNSDGAVLETDTDVPYGSTPSYDGETPAKSGDAQYSYSFTGWSPEVKAVTGDVTYTAQYSSSTNGYTVTWKNSDGTVLETDTDVPYGSTPSYDGETPTKSGSVEFSYTFSGWSPEVVSVIGDATYTAQYSSSTNGYMVTWKNYDGSLLETDEEVPYGSMPSFDGETPTRADDDTYRYTFSGWDPEVVEVTGNATYKATYSYEKIKPQYTIDFDLNGGTSASYSGSKTVEEFSMSLLFFDCVKEGWNFRGWSYQGTKIFDEKGNQLSTFSMAKEMTFVALYAQTARMMIVTNMEGAGSISGEGEYPYNTYVDVSAQPNQGYDFVGWFYENTILSSTPDYKYMMWSEDVTLEARFELASFSLIVHSNNEDYGLVLLKSKTNFNYLPQYEEHRDYTTSVTVAAYSKTDVRFLGWYDENNSLVETNAVYSFVMPNRDYSLEAKWNYFTVNYVLNGGTNNPLNPNEYTSESGSITLEEPSRPGYEFLGWTLDNNPVSAIDSSWIRNIALVANWKTSDYSITYILNGGENDASNPSSYTVEDDPIALLNPTRNGYTFEGWYRTSAFEQQITFIDPTEKSNVILYAKWSVVFYSITYELNGGSNSPSNPSSYTVEDEMSFSSPERAGYTFLGWYDGETKYTGIAKGTTGAVALSAHWNDGDAYQVTLDPNGGNVSASAVHVQYGCAYSLPTPSKTGYDFSGWYDGTIRVSNTGTWSSTAGKSLLAHWDPIHYAITYTLNGGSNSPSNPSSYTVKDEVSFSSPERAGYTFLGWYDGETEYTGIAQGTTGTLSLEARWSAKLNSLSVTSEDESEGVVSVTSGNGYTDEAITVVATPASGYIFKGWYVGEAMVSDQTTFTFAMSASDYSLVARFWTQEEKEAAWPAEHGVTPTLSNDGKTITYGLYPQTRVSDSDLIAALNALDDSAIGANGWYFYNDEYYAKVSAQPYSSNYKFDDGATIVDGTTYWFECETIKWDVLSETDGEYYVLSDVLLDAHRYNKSYEGEKDGHYANNYQHSEIRAWLNADFYGSAFALGDSAIQTTEVDNSASTTNNSSNSYACANTQDKVFLPSHQDYLNGSYGFSESARRRCKTTDWARARGAFYNTSSSYLYNGRYWTRSPNSGNSRNAWHVDYDGMLDINYFNYVGSASFCVRPGLSIHIA